MSKIVAISDLHSNLPKIPKCDILLIAGDICPDRENRTESVGGSDAMFFQMKWLNSTFRDWLDSIPAKEVVAVWGNHDFIGQKRPHMVPTLRWHLLTDNICTIGDLKIYGSPWQLPFNGWAFNMPDEEMKRKWDAIPDDVDIIVSHGPPAGYGDLTLDGRHEGSMSMMDRIRDIKPKLVVFGHIHEGRGKWEIEAGNRPPIVLANVTILDRCYDPVHKPMKFTL